MSNVRLQKYIASQGICSRRKAEQLISLGKVSVNGTVITEMGVSVDPLVDVVEVDGKKIATSESSGHVYIILNKPIDYISSASSEQGQSVLELLTKEHFGGKVFSSLPGRVYPVGRLDKDSEGLILLTDDGELTNTLTHPRYGHEKEYEVTIDKRMTKDAEYILSKGMHIDGEDLKGIEIKNISNRGKRTIVTVVLTEGKNRQIRKMFGRLNFHVISLRRTRIGKLTIGSLPVGKWKYIQKESII